MRKIIIMGTLFISLMCMCGCGGKDDEETELDNIVHNYSEEDISGSKRTTKVSISTDTVNMIKDNGDRVKEILSEMEITETDGIYEGYVTESDVAETEELLSAVIDEYKGSVFGEAESILNYSLENGNITVTSDMDTITKNSDLINEVCAIVGVYRKMAEPLEEWNVIVNIYLNDNGETYRYGAAGVNEDTPFSMENVTVYDTSTPTDAE